jgi:transcriptional regulator with XRE-family HTH domain
VTDPLTFSTFGEMLRFLRRRARLTQRDLGIAVGYSEGHINRFEKSRHLPDPSTVTALFIPAARARARARRSPGRAGAAPRPEN